LNEKRIQQVLELEKEANALRDEKISEAAQLPVKAEKEAQTFLEKTRVDAAQEARRLLEKAEAKEESAEILSLVEEKIRHTEAHAKSNFNRAVTYVLARVIGRE
jgi:hypothetical protein